MNLAACAGLALGPVTGSWYRTGSARYLSTMLATLHTTGVVGRFSPGPLIPAGRQFEILYLAEDHITAAFELGSMVGNPYVPGRSFSPKNFPPTATVTVQVVLQSAADLTDVANAQRPLDVTAQLLTGDWGAYQIRSSRTSVSAPTGLAPTQELGEELYKTPNLEGFQSISAKAPCNRTLMIFPQKLKRGSSVQVHDPSGQVIGRIDGLL